MFDIIPQVSETPLLIGHVIDAGAITGLALSTSGALAIALLGVLPSVTFDS